ncbi:MAG: hypothetical protein AMJ89_02040 [candidate division Zixibacteria bacterium SM23_73]|nr:MAG: hypothetical protein AMJ89_02040 [candidate division Zixibacteria bacterium SM23_73]
MTKTSFFPKASLYECRISSKDCFLAERSSQILFASSGLEGPMAIFPSKTFPSSFNNSKKARLKPKP